MQFTSVLILEVKHQCAVMYYCAVADGYTGYGVSSSTFHPCTEISVFRDVPFVSISSRGSDVPAKITEQYTDTENSAALMWEPWRVHVRSTISR